MLKLSARYTYLRALYCCAVFANFVLMLDAVISFADTSRRERNRLAKVSSVKVENRKNKLSTNTKLQENITNKKVDESIKGEQLKAYLNTDNTDIARFFKEGNYIAVLERYKQIDLEYTQFAIQSIAAKSAWAIGLVDSAREIWCNICNKLDGEAKFQAILENAIMEFQEREYARAIELAQVIISEIDKQNENTMAYIKGQCSLVIADSYSRMSKFGESRVYYEKAILYGNKETEYEARLQLGQILSDLGDTTKAKEILQEIGLEFHRATEAIALLEDIGISEKDYLTANKWSQERLKRVSIDSDSDVEIYRRIRILAGLGKKEDAKKELNNLKVRFSEGNVYYILGQALLTKEELLQYM